MNTVISLLILYIFNSLHKDTYYEIAQGMLDMIDKLPSLSVTDFAAEMGTSVSTINKFCRELGFQNFKILKAQLESTRKGRINQIIQRMEDIKLEEIYTVIRTSLRQDIDFEKVLEEANAIAEKLHDARKAYITGAVFPLALSVNMLEDLFLMGCPLRYIHNSYYGFAEAISDQDYCLILSNTGRFIELNKAYFLTLYTKFSDMGLISQNLQFVRYEKITNFIQIPPHEESLADNHVMLAFIDLIEYCYYIKYFQGKESH